MASKDKNEVEKQPPSKENKRDATVKAKLLKRCKLVGFEVKEEEDEDNYHALVVDMPAGREKRPVYLWSTDRVQAFLSVPFEKYVFLRPYDAICSYTDGTIEAVVQALDRTPDRVVRRILLGKKIGEEFDESDVVDLKATAPSGTLVLTLSSPSEDLRVLSPRARRSTLSLKIHGVHANKNVDAVGLLRRIGDSFLFQIDSTLGIALNISRERSGLVYKGNRRKALDSLTELQFPTHEYDDAPLSLFWYARSALGMPLLQFLAYYQVVEYYFQTYYKTEAGRKIRRVLKDPTFRADRDADIGRVLSSLMGNRGVMGDERSMLRATIQECVDPDELRQFLTKTEERSVFFSSKTKGLTTTKITLANPAADLRNDTADRIYEIRCKIVHTKADRDGEGDLLLPFSEEADQLYHDIELVQYIAQRVLITASTPISI